MVEMAETTVIRTPTPFIIDDDNADEIFFSLDKLLPSNIRDDKNAVLDVINKHCDEINCAFLLVMVSNRLRDDEEVIQAVVQTQKPGQISAVRFASWRIRNDPKFITDLIQRSSNRQEDYMSGMAMMFATASLQANAGFVFDMIVRHKLRSEYIPEILKKDKDFVLRLINNGHSMHLISTRAHNCAIDAVISSVRCQPSNFNRLPYISQIDPDIVEAALKGRMEKRVANLNDEFFEERFDLMKARFGVLMKKFNRASDPVLLNILSWLIEEKERPRRTSKHSRRHSKAKQKQTQQPDAVNSPLKFNASAWLHKRWERIWLIGLIANDTCQETNVIDTDICRNIIEFAGLEHGIGNYEELSSLESLINLLAMQGAMKDVATAAAI
jgi:hypothetical protein